MILFNSDFRSTQDGTDQRGQSRQNPIVEVITPEIYNNLTAYSSRGPFSGIWSRTLRIKVTGQDGSEKIDVRIPVRPLLLSFSSEGIQC